MEALLDPPTGSGARALLAAESGIFVGGSGGYLSTSSALNGVFSRKKKKKKLCTSRDKSLKPLCCICYFLVGEVAVVYRGVVANFMSR